MAGETQSGEFTRNDLFRGLFDIGQRLASPLAERLMGEPDSNRNALNESIEYNRLNGSGPNNPEMAERAPQTYNEFLFGNPAGMSAVSVGGVKLGLPMLAIIGVVAWLIFRR